MATLDIAVPDIGDFDEVTVIELLVKPGDTIKADQSLLTVESDKASMEIPSSAAGVVKEVKVKLGDKIKQGSLVLVLESTSASSLPGAMGSPSPQPSPVKGRIRGFRQYIVRLTSGSPMQRAARPAREGASESPILRLLRLN